MKTMTNKQKKNTQTNIKPSYSMNEDDEARQDSKMKYS